MVVSVSYPGVYIDEVPSGVRTIAGVSTSIGLFAGWSARGSTTEAVRVTSFGDYEREFGPPDPRSELGYALKHFFANGGAEKLAPLVDQVLGEQVKRLRAFATSRPRT